MTIQKVLIFENWLGGHRAHYVKVLADELERLQAKVILALPSEEMDSAECSAFLKSAIETAEVFHLPKIQSGLSVRAYSNARLDMLRNAVSMTQAQHVYVPFADGISQAWGMKLRPEKLFPPDTVAEGLIMRGSFAYGAANLRKRVANELAFQFLRRSRWTRIHQLDPLAMTAIEKRDPKFANRNRLIPEAVDPLEITDRNLACKILNLNPNNKFICCPGGIETRKGVDLLIHAFAKSDIPNVQLVLLGRHSDQIRIMLQSEYSRFVSEQRIFSIDRFATESEFDALFAAADLVCVPHPRQIGSASTLIRAAKADKRILASDWGWVGWATEKHNLGTTCNVRDIEDFSNALRCALEDTSSISLDPQDIARKVQFLNFHSRENHVACFTKLYRETNGIQ